MSKSAHRQFYDFSFSNDHHAHQPCHSEHTFHTSDETGHLVRSIRSSIIGNNYTFKGPYGKRTVLYCDYVASGRSVRFIEDYISKEVLPAYGNTHTTTSITGLQTTMFRDEARTIIRDCTNASEYDAVIFAGSGTTGAAHHLISCLKPTLDFTKTIVIAGPYDHHSTLLPWREVASRVVQIGLNHAGEFDRDKFRSVLLAHRQFNGKVIGCMSACSNITGHMLPVDDITSELHAAGALAFWDYAAAAPYVQLNMNPVNVAGDASVYKDAMFISAHKFVGGPGSPGILIAKKAMFTNETPAICGGGTVFFVRRENHLYLRDIEHREEGGTPDIIGSIRAALSFKLKQSLGVGEIERREARLASTALSVWRNVPQLVILGDTSTAARGFAVFSLMFQTPAGSYIHHNMAASLLNDLFGIQTRGGCACAGPYALHLLGIDERLAKRYETALVDDERLDRVQLRRREHSEREVLRPGFVRLNLPYFMSDEELDFVIKAVSMVAEHGWKLLPDYLFNPSTGEWKVRGHKVLDDRRWLGSIDFTAHDNIGHALTEHPATPPDYYQKTLEEAETLLRKPASLSVHTDNQIMFEETQDLLWFMLPSQAGDLLTKPQESEPFHQPPVFTPVQYHSGVNEVTANDPAESLGDLSLSNEASEESEPPSSADSRPCEAPPENRASAVSGTVQHTKLTKSEKIQQAGGWRRIPKVIMKPFLKAVEEYEMFKNGDRVLICLSGGKDSLSLLHAVKQYTHVARSHGVNLELGAVTVDPGSTSYDPTPLIPYLAELGVPYFYEQQGIIKQAGSLPNGCDSLCSFCSRMKRGRIYKCARDNGYNVLVMGQHLDDLTESFMMSIFHNGLLRTMKAHYTVTEGDLRVIRPFVYCREKDLRDFALSNHLPIIPENCPACFEQPKERQRVKQLLAAQEVMFPDVYSSLLTSLQPLMAIRGSEMTLFRNLLHKSQSNHSNGMEEDSLNDL